MLVSIVASQIFDSRGNPTVRVVVTTDKGRFEAQVPSGASKGSYEAHELRDGGDAYGGQGVLQAVTNVNDVLAPALLESGVQIQQQKEIDNLLCKLDGTKQKSKMGANAILGVSMACARAGAAHKGVELFEHIAELAEMPTDTYVLPVPFMNQIVEWRRTFWNTLAPQEFMVAPVGATSFSQAMQINSEVYHCLKTLISKESGKAFTGLGDEGGYAPPLTTFDEALSLLERAVKAAGYTVGHSNDVVFGVDPASVEFFDAQTKTYDLGFKLNQEKASSEGWKKTGSDMQHLYTKLLSEHPIALLEDPFAEDDLKSWESFCSTIDSKVELVGDDLLATNPERIKMAAEQKLCNSLLLKINQIGTITEAIGNAKLAMSHGWAVFVSHRSGETVDDFIADLTVGLRCGHLKSGAPARGERLAKYNRLLAIEALLEARSKHKGVTMHTYAGHQFRNPE